MISKKRASMRTATPFDSSSRRPRSICHWPYSNTRFSPVADSTAFTIAHPVCGFGLSEPLIPELILRNPARRSCRRS